MRKADGPVLVVPVTDGEKTCEGDPPAVIAELKESDINVNLNLVSFAIDDQELADEFAA